MPVRKRSTRHRRPELSRVQRGLLRGVPLEELLKMAAADGTNPFEAFGPPTPEAASRLWDVGGEEALPEWICQRPGTRPSVWWQVVAPALADEVGLQDRPLWRSCAGSPAEEQRALLGRLGALEPGE